MTTVTDIFPDDPPTLPGRGWRAPSTANGEPSRDVMSDATLRVALRTTSEHRILIEIEPLAAATAPLFLTVLADGEPPVRFALSARSTIAFALRPAHPRVAEIRLRAEHAGAANAARASAYRVFRVSVHVSRPDIGGVDFRPGPGWCLLEEFRGERFRWAGDEVVLVRTSAAGALELEVEPGPSVVAPPLKLGAFGEDGTELAAFEPSARERIVIPLQSYGAEVRHVILRAAQPGRVLLDDARVLNYRAFASPRDP